MTVEAVNAGRDGRERLLDTAEALYARRGIHGVSLREITRAADQRNASVVQYHFGSRAGLVAAIVERHLDVVDAARTALLDAAEAAGRSISVRDAMCVLVEPLAERLLTPSGRDYLRILQHLVDLPPHVGGQDRPMSKASPSLERVSALLAHVGPAMPAVLRTERRAQTTSFLIRALADRAKLIDGDHGDGTVAGPALDHEVFVANLIDVLVAVLTTRPSTGTLAACPSSAT